MALKIIRGKCKKCGKEAQVLFRGKTNAKNKFIPQEILAFACLNPECGFAKKVAIKVKQNHFTDNKMVK